MTYRIEGVYDAIADRKRRDILDLLREEPLNIAELSAHFTVSRTAIEKHLRILQDAGLVESERVGRTRVLRANPKPLEEVWNWLTSYDAFWTGRLDDLKQAVEKSDE